MKFIDIFLYGDIWHFQEMINLHGKLWCPQLIGDTFPHRVSTRSSIQKRLSDQRGAQQQTQQDISAP